jgi:hypothetical protein
MPGSILPHVRKRIVSECTKLLTKPLDNYVVRVPNDVDVLRSTLRKGDVLLVEGDQRISQVIRYLTQSSWSHCALYVGDALLRGPVDQAEWARAKFGAHAGQLLVEAVEGLGVTACPVAKYVPYNIRICRPEGLRRADAEEVVRYACSRIGDRYDVRHIVDLARYFFPVSIVPRRWRSAALTFGRDRDRAVICSTMIARGLARVGYPILPQQIEPAADGPGLQRMLPRRWRRQQARFRRRDPKLVTPRDFDLSPYFQIVKFNHLPGAKFDYHDIIWEEAEPEPAAVAPPMLPARTPQTGLA